MDYWLNGYDQQKALEWVLRPEEAIFFSYLNRATRGTRDKKPWAKKFAIEGREMYSIAPVKFETDMPHLFYEVKDPNSKIRKFFREFADKGLVELKIISRNTRYFVLTEKTIGWGTATGSKRAHRENDINTQDDAPTMTSNIDPNNLSKPHFLKALTDRGVDPDIAAEWHSIRKLKRGIFSVGAIERTELEAAKAKITLARAIEISVAKGWMGFEASYLDGNFSTSNKEPTPPSRKILNRDLPAELIKRLQG